MTPLESTIKMTYDWATDRMYILNQMQSYENAKSIEEEFYEWFYHKTQEHEVVSMNFIGN